MPKKKISVTVDKEVLDLIENTIQTGTFRNRSHIIEFSVKKFLEEKRGKTK